MKNVAVLLSGRGSNFMALAAAIKQDKIPARIVAVVSDLAEAPGLKWARDKGYANWCIRPLGKSREEFDREVVYRLQEAGTQIVCLAGFMRLLSPLFVQHFPMRVLNIHPSLLPAFPGLHAQQQAVRDAWTQMQLTLMMAQLRTMIPVSIAVMMMYVYGLMVENSTIQALLIFMDSSLIQMAVQQA